MNTPTHLPPASSFGYNDEGEPLSPKKVYTDSEALEEAALHLDCDKMIEYAVDRIFEDRDAVRGLVERIIHNGDSAKVGMTISEIVQQDLIQFMNEEYHGFDR